MGIIVKNHATIRLMSNDKESKKWYTSKTLQGAAVALIGSVLAILTAVGIDVPFTAESATPIISSVFAGVGFVYTIIGRFTAKKPVTL